MKYDIAAWIFLNHYSPMTEPFIELSEQVFDTRYFSFGQPDGASHVPVNIFFGGREHCKKDYRIDRPGFPVFLMEYVLDGLGDLTLNGIQHTLKKGCVYWYGPDIPCHLVTDPERPLVKIFFAFVCPEGSPSELYGLQRHFIGSSRGGDLVGNLVRMLFEEACSGHQTSWRICCSYLDIILTKCVRSEVLERNASEKAWYVFRQIKELIEDNYLELSRMEDIAAKAELSSAYISRLFRRYHHMTPYSFLVQKKMEHALDLLRQRNISVQQAAAMTGFEDPFHFSRVFKRFKGISPSEVRNVIPG
ncbi:MAG: AraC family transcriptional regulator [Puniceicoccaceae bacterium]